MMKMVTLVYVSREQQKVPINTAWELCCNPAISDKIMDVLTPDAELQRLFRHCLDDFDRFLMEHRGNKNFDGNLTAQSKK